jgi:Ice-binding-like
MSHPTLQKRSRRIAVALATGCALAAVPAVAQASQVNLGTVSPFVVLAGAAVTNTGPSVLNGDLGVAPGTALTGFGAPATVNGATHDNDGVANNAKADLVTAYNVAAGQPVSPANNLTGQDLGNKSLVAGAYRFTSSAQLTGPLTLDAQGDPNAQFVFEIASALTTASASSVNMINGGNPCNVYWQVGSSATLGSTTAFKGNLMALSSISLNNGVTVIGRMLARNGQVSLINDTLTSNTCGTTSSGGGGSGGPGGTGTGTGTGTGPGGLTTKAGTARLRRTRGEGVGAPCTTGFHAAVRGHLIKRVTFTLDGKHIATRNKSPFSVSVRALSGRHKVRAHVTFKDRTRSKYLSLGYQACGAAVAQPRQGPSQFTG